MKKREREKERKKRKREKMNQENFVTPENEYGSLKGPDENTKIGLKRVWY